ncbi:MAG: Trp family transcriptional regulator [Candidatus Paceibacterota bacterium]|jgi:uncharacterized protein YerC
MTHISKTKVSEKISSNLEKNFVLLVTKAAGARSIKTFLEELFTPTEKIMLSKRLAIIVMLVQGFSFLQIQKTLKVSSATVSNFQHACELGGFAYVQSMLGKKKERGQFLKALEEALSFRLPPKTGRGRWDFLNK